MMQAEKQIIVPMEQLMPVIRLQLETGGKAPLQVTGSSMHPTLRHRKDSVLLVPVVQPLKKGDIILYRRANGAYVLHRIVKRPKGEELVCSGDNQYAPETVAAEQVIAIVAELTRKGKRIPVSKNSYRLYVWLLTALFPVRRPVLALRRMLGKVRRRHKKR